MHEYDNLQDGENKFVKNEKKIQKDMYDIIDYVKLLTK